MPQQPRPLAVDHRWIMEAPKGKSLSTGKIISLVVIVALVAAVAFLIVQNFGLKSDVADSLETAESLTAEIAEVEKQVDEYKFALNEKDLDIESKQRMLNERDSLITAKENKINDLLRRNKISQQEAEKMRGRVEQLEHYVKKYQGQIDVLKAELAMKNLEIDSLKQEIGDTKDSLRKTTDDVIVKDIKLRAASKLSAHSFAFYRYKQSGSPVQESEFLPSQLDRLKICIQIAENAANTAGDKIVYFQVKDTQGKLVRDESKSGYFKNDGADVPYSVMARMQYEKQAIQVCVDFAQPSGFRYEDGDYTVQAFCDGFEIGHSQFTVD